MKHITLDPMGQFTAATVGDHQPSSFTLTAHLKETVDPA